MVQQANADYGLANRIANENQLLSEEKWIIEALKVIKKQRHSLQVEKLHLMSLLSDYTSKRNTHKAPACKESNPIAQNLEIPEIPVVPINMDIPYVRDNECNEEELNLSVSNNFIQNDREMDMEEYEEEDAEDDDFDIDMNMFMNGEHNEKI